MRKATFKIRQGIINLISHYDYNVIASSILSLKAVYTIDRLRCAENTVSTFLVQRNVFWRDHINPLASWLLTNEAIYRFRNWSDYAERCVDDGIRLLRRYIDGQIGVEHGLLWMPPPEVERSMRAEHRVRYFVNGASLN